MAVRYADAWKNMMPSNALLRNPHKGFTTFQRFAEDALNQNWSVKTGWKIPVIQDRLICSYQIPFISIWCINYHNIFLNIHLKHFIFSDKYDKLLLNSTIVEFNFT